MDTVSKADDEVNKRLPNDFLPKIIVPQIKDYSLQSDNSLIKDGQQFFQQSDPY